MSKRNTAVEEADDDAEVSANALDNLMDTAYENLPDVLETIPGGTWKLRNRNAAFKEATEKENSKFLFFYIPVAPSEDVDPEALSAAGDDYDYTNNQIVVTHYVETLRDLKKVMAFIALHGIDLEGLNAKQAMKKVKGKEIMANIGSRSYEGQFGIVNSNTANAFAPVKDEE